MNTERKKDIKKTVGQDKLKHNSSVLDNSLEVYFTNLENTGVCVQQVPACQ